MIKVLDLAKYIIGSIPVDNLKLQKLLFYSQAVCLVRYEKVAFGDKIEAWMYGPVIPGVYRAFRKYGFDVIPPSHRPVRITDVKIVDSTDMVMKFYGSMTGAELISETHSEEPWRQAFQKGPNMEIGNEDIRRYYSNVFNFSDEEE